MRYIKSGLMLLSAALMSGGCEQGASEHFDSKLERAKSKMNNSSEAVAAMACPEQPDQNSELLSLKQQLQQTQQQLARSNEELVAARSQLKGDSSSKLVAQTQTINSIEQEQVKLSVERRVHSATARHVKQLEQRLTEQDQQLSQLHKTLLKTEAGCREIADELTRKAPSS